MKILDKDLKTLNLDNNIINDLNKKNIFTIKELWKCKRNELKKIGLNDKEIQQIIIKLQLNGLDLNKKLY